VPKVTGIHRSVKIIDFGLKTQLWTLNWEVSDDICYSVCRIQTYLIGPELMEADIKKKNKKITNFSMLIELTSPIHTLTVQNGSLFPSALEFRNITPGLVMSHANFHWWLLSRQLLNSYSVLSLVINRNEYCSTLRFSHKIRFSHPYFRVAQTLRYAPLRNVFPILKLCVLTKNTIFCDTL
jgi:hypothetical protein